MRTGSREWLLIALPAVGETGAHPHFLDQKYRSTCDFDRRQL